MLLRNLLPITEQKRKKQTPICFSYNDKIYVSRLPKTRRATLQARLRKGHRKSKISTKFKICFRPIASNNKLIRFSEIKFLGLGAL